MSNYINETLTNPNQHYLGLRPGLQTFFALTLTITAVFGFFGNILVIMAVISSKALRKPCNMFIVNLAIADLLVTTVVDPFNVIGAYVGESYFEENYTLCQLIASICAPACLCSMFSICAISVNRYVMICRFQSYGKIYTWKNTLIMCAGLWVCSYLIHLPNHVGWGHNAFDPAYYICTFSIATHSYALFYVTLGVFVPLVILFLAYLGIFCHYWRNKRQLRRRRTVAEPRDLEDRSSSQLYTNEASGQTLDLTATGPQQKPSVRRDRRTFQQEDMKLAKTLFTVFIAFMICWSPFAIFVLMKQPQEIPGWIYMIAIIMAHGNSSINCILYGITNEKFRDAYCNVLGIKKSAAPYKFSKAVPKDLLSVQPESLFDVDPNSVTINLTFLYPS